MDRVCTSCRVPKPHEAFARDRALDRPGVEGRTSTCKECRRVASRAWSKANPERKAALNAKHASTRSAYYADPKRRAAYRDRWLQKTYGITAREYDDLLAKQSGVCAICSQPERGKRNRYLAVDHCHRTGVVRGLLCTHCNRALGLFGDSQSVLANAISYVERTKK